MHRNFPTNYAFVRRVTVQDKVDRAALAEALLTLHEIRRLLTNLEQMEADDLFFGCANQMLVVGRKS